MGLRHIASFSDLNNHNIRQGTMLVSNTFIRLGDLGCIHS